MADVKDKLRLKYGLGHEPSDSEVREWSAKADSLIREGVSPEEAGRRAARSVFPDYDRISLKAEADTIEALLDAARKI